MSFFKFKITIYGQELSFKFILNAASALSIFLKMHEANLNMQNVILYLYATCQCVRACRKGRPLGIGTCRMDSLLVLAHTS